jgi:hypothetical protein
VGVTQVRIIRFSEKRGHGGRFCKGEMLFSTLDAAETEAREWIRENRRAAVDIRVESLRDDGKLDSSRYAGQMRWEDTRSIPVRYPYPDT